MRWPRKNDASSIEQRREAMGVNGGLVTSVDLEPFPGRSYSDIFTAADHIKLEFDNPRPDGENIIKAFKFSLPPAFDVTVEIPKGQRNKYENKIANTVVLWG